MTRVIVVLACLLFAAPAGAHTMSLEGARHAAENWVLRVASSADPPPRVSVRRCYRRSSHVADCRALFGFGAVTCERTVRVRFVSPQSRRVARRFVGDLICH